MNFEIIKNPVGILQIHLDKNEKITAETGAMAFMKGEIETDTRMRKGGFFSSLKIAAFGRESFFVNDFIAQTDGCTVGLTGSLIGDIEQISLFDEEFIVQSGAYVASTSGLIIDTQWQGFKKGIFGQNLFMLKVTGSGELFVNAYGGIVRTDIAKDEKFVLDNYHLVAITSSAKWDVKKHGGFKTAIFGGEALVIEIIGPATVYYQTKNLQEFVSILDNMLPRRNSGSTHSF